MQVKAYLKAGAHVNTRTKHTRQTALMLASVFGQAAVVQALIDAKAELNAVDVVGNTALMLAVMQGYSHIVKKLLSAGADANKGNNEGDTPLSWAQRHDDQDMIALLKSKSVTSKHTTNTSPNPAEDLLKWILQSRTRCITAIVIVVILLLFGSC